MHAKQFLVAVKIVNKIRVKKAVPYFVRKAHIIMVFSLIKLFVLEKYATFSSLSNSITFILSSILRF